jgi:hypothetical protein
MHEAANNSLNRGFDVLYVGDHDPSGMHMSEVDLPERLDRYGADIDIERIALLPDDTLHLPHFATADKLGDPRHNWYREHYGDRCWELDAMNPPDLRERVEEEICARINWTAWDRSRKAEEAEKATIDTVLANWKKAISRPDQK